MKICFDFWLTILNLMSMGLEVDGCVGSDTLSGGNNSMGI